MRTANWRGWLPGPGFPLRFRCRHSLLGHPIPAEGFGLSSRSAYRARLSARTRTGLPRFARTSCDRGVPPIPRGQWCSPGRVASPTGTRRFPAAVLLPRHDNPASEALHGASTGVYSRSPVRSSRRPRPRDGTGGASALTLSFAPRRHRQRTSGAGTGHRARTWNNTYDVRRTSDLPCSLDPCDLASHGDLRARGTRDSRPAIVLAPVRLDGDPRVAAFVPRAAVSRAVASPRIAAPPRRSRLCQPRADESRVLGEPAVSQDWRRRPRPRATSGAV